MVLENPLYQQANTYSAAQDRGLIAAVFDTEGVFGGPAGTELKVSPRGAGANMSVDIALGRAVVAGDDAANQGSYLLRSTALENRAIGAAPGSNSRIDLVVAQVRDANVTGGVSSDWDIVVIPGVVAPTPTAPAVPNTAIPLAQVLVAAGTVSIDAAKITERRGTAGSAAYPSLAGGSTITASGAAVKPLVLKGAAGQTGHLLDLKQSDGTSLVVVVNSGALARPPESVANVSFLLHPTNSTQNLLFAEVATSLPLVVKGAAAQTNRLTEWLNSADAVLLGVGAGGVLEFNAANTAATATAGGGAALPATVAGFLLITVNGTARRVPFYAA